jgi:uncharacterized protein
MDVEGSRTYILRRLREELPATRTYHSLAHTLDVYASAIDIAEQEGVQGDDLVVLKLAALYHDSGFILQDKEHEDASCRLVREVLPGFGSSDAQVEAICAMIQATRIPQSPADALARILCDADLDYLGRGDFKVIGDTLFAEMRSYGVLSTEREWNELQVRFLERHHFFTATNIALREPVKQAHLLRIRTWLSDHPE